MEFEVSYNLENEQQFWDELDDILSAQSESYELIDNTLRSYLSFTTKFREEYLQTEYEIAQCSYRLLRAPIFTSHKEYVRRQIVYGLLQEDDCPTLHLIAAFLLFDGRSDDATFEMMKVEGAFPRLIELVRNNDIQEDARLHRLLLELTYEMSRIQRLTWEDLASVDDAFVLYLFEIIEGLSDDVDDPYHYPVIKVLLVLNEQYMVASSVQTAAGPHAPLTNRVLKAISTHGSDYKIFGCNLILLLNRESETSLQLLILKLLYLLFLNVGTAEYFYTNDLYVLLDVILRNLLDLPSDSAPAVALRHTYLRVLHPILVNSQMRLPPHYKKHEIRTILRMLAESGTHFAPVDDTTLRLVKRCTDVPWLGEDEEIPQSSPTEPRHNLEAGDGQKEIARRALGMSVKEGGESASSVAAVAEHTAEPGVKTPSKSHADQNQTQ